MLKVNACWASGGDSLSIRRLGIENGLSNNLVRCIYQDESGFIWFGTRDGLNRYDGYGFKIFRNQINDPSSLGHNIIHTISSDKNHNLWIGTRQGVSIYNGVLGEFKQAFYRSVRLKKDKPINGVIRDITRDQKGNMLIGTEGLGLLISKNGRNADQIPLIVKGKANYDYGVQLVKVASDGKVWVFAQNLGLCYLDTSHNQLILVNSVITLAFSLGVSQNQVWIGTINGLYGYDIAKKQIKLVVDNQERLANLSISSIAIDKFGDLWLGTNGKGVFVYRPSIRKADLLSEGDMESELKGEQVYSIFIDKTARKWIGTSSVGVKVVDPYKKSFTSRGHVVGRNSIAGNAVSAFLESVDKKLWIGTDGSGLSVWDRKTDHFINYSHQDGNEASLSSNFITSMVQDYEEKIWLGTFTEGLTKYDPITDKYHRYKCINPITGVESKVVFTLFEDREHQLWAGTLRRGTLMGALYKFNRKTGVFDLFDSALSDLFTIKQDKNGILWAGNLNQLIKIDRIGKKHSFYNLGYTVRAIYEDSSGWLWVGTEGGGLIKFDPKKGKIINRYTTSQGMSNNSVLTIIDDLRGNIWMSTYNGLTAFNQESRTFRNFYQSDGLQSNQFQINSGIRLSSGELAFGGIKGFSIFDPSRMQIHSNPLDLFLTYISVNNEPLEKRPELIQRSAGNRILELTIPYDQAVFSFVFTALEYTAPDKITYKYMMEGWDRGWTISGKERNATYTHISDGSYKFRVKYTNAEGVWSKDEILLMITVLPPWYRTWWAYLGYFVIAAILLYVYMRYRTAQTKLKYEVRLVNLEAQRKEAEYDSQVARHNLERAEHEKERLINEQEKELTEKRMSFFTNISHEFRSPLSLIINPINDLIKKSDQLGEERPELSMIHRNAKRMLNLVDQLLLFRKSDAGFDKVNPIKVDFDMLCKEVYLCFTQQAASSQIDYTYKAFTGKYDLYVDKMKIEIVLFNLISNALKYTPSGGKVSLRLDETADMLKFSVSDTGPGIPDVSANRIFDRFYQADRSDNTHKSGFGIGLYLAKQFIEIHGGEISFENIAGSGCIFTISLPKFKAAFDELVLADPISIDILPAADLPHLHSDMSVFNSEVYLETEFISDQLSILIVDDELDIRTYVASLFSDDYTIYEAENGKDGLLLTNQKLPDLIITDYKMQGIDGIEFIQLIKSNPTLSYIPVILLTASSSDETKLQSVHGGADDYIGKPFEAEYLIARVANLIKNRNTLQNYFFNRITLQSNALVVSEEYKKFLDLCIYIVEKHLTDSDFGIQVLAEEVGMSHSNLYKRVKSISGQSVNSFIRFIRLRKAAELMINSDYNVTEVAFRSGFNDAKYFGKQFLKLFGSTPSEFIRKHRATFNKSYKIK